MKKWLLSLVAILFVGAALYATTADANSFRQVKQVSGSSLVMKKAMTTSSATVATLKRGDFVTVFSTSNGWASVEVKGQKGYVNAAYLANAKSTIKIASSKGGLVVKASPSKSAATSAVLKYKMIVEDFGSVGAGWNFVQYGNVTGYVASTFINVPKTTTMYVNVGAGSNLNVRNIASQRGEVVAKLAHNTKVTVHSTLSGWSYVSVGSTRGYVAARYLKASGTLTGQNASDSAPK